MSIGEFILVRNGEVRVRRQGHDGCVVSAALPTTRIDADTIHLISSLAMLQQLDLCGRHLPTDVLRVADVEALASTHSLTAQATFLKAAELGTLLAGLHGLRSLNLAGCAVDATVLQTLASLPYLEDLTLGTRRPDAEAHIFIPPPLVADALVTIGQCRSLRRLALRTVKVDLAMVEAISALPGLIELDLGETGVDDRALGLLARARSLRSLDLGQTNVGDSAVDLLADSALDRLCVAYTRLDNAGVDRLLARGGWRALDLSGLPVSRDSMPHLAALPSLESLILDHVNRASELFVVPGAHPVLRSLSLRGDRVTAAVVRAIGETCPVLRDLVVGAVDGAGIEALLQLPGLQSLEMTIDDTDAALWQGLGELASLRYLDASAVGLESPLPHGLATLRLRGKISVGAMAELGAAPGLEELDLAEAQLLGHNDGTMGFSALRTLIAQGAGLDDAGMRRLAQLPRCEALYVSGNQLTAKGLQVLTSHPLLHTLELRDCSLDDAIVPTLMTLARLHCLDVAGSPVTPGALALLAALPNVQSLGIDGAQLDARAAAALSEAPLLTELYLYPSFDGTAFKHLAALKQVREIRLMGVLLERTSAAVLAALPGLRSLQGSAATPEALALLRTVRPDIRLNVLHNDGLKGGRRQ